jgi:uncharacterized repeat protein (TIGR03803 family)
MNKNFDELARGLTQSTTQRRILKKCGVGLVGVLLACGEATIGWADWTPPESNVTPPAVLTLDTFPAPEVYQPLVVGPDGALYGSTQDGGTNGYGTLFRVEINGTFTKLHDFTGPDGDGPSAPLVVGPDGALYSSTPNGGTNGPGGGYGTLFRVETNGTFTKLHDFNFTDGADPRRWWWGSTARCTARLTMAAPTATMARCSD